MHVPGGCETGCGMAERSTKERDMAESSGMKHDEDKYGPWMVVTRRRGQKGTTKDVQHLDPTKSAPSLKPRFAMVKNNPSNGHFAWKEATKLGFTPEFNMEKVGHGGLVMGPNVKIGGLTQLKAHVSPSVKGKKVIARNRALSHLTKDASSNSTPTLILVPQNPSVLGSKGADFSFPFQFSAAPQAKLGSPLRERGINQLGSSSSGKQGEDGVDSGVVRSAPNGSLDDNSLVEGKEYKLGSSTTRGPTVEEVCRQSDDLVRERANRACYCKDGGKDGEDGVEFEGEGGIDTSS